MMKDDNINAERHKKNKQKFRPISKHMESFGDRYNPATKILTTQNGEQLQKYAHGYFTINKLDRKKITKTIKKILESYPQWILEQKQFNTKDFSYCFSKMIEAHPFLMKLNQRPGPKQVSFLKTIDHIRFPYLTQIQINLQHSINLESFGWIQCPGLQIIIILSPSMVSSLNPFAKTNFKNLKILRLEIDELQNSDKRNYDLTKISRIKMYKKNKNSKGAFYFDKNQGIINFLRRDVSDISALAKIQIVNLQNFRIPQITPKLGKNRLRIQNTIKVLNKKFNNQTSFYRLIEHNNHHFIDDIYDTEQLNSIEQSDSDFQDQQSNIDSNNQQSENSQF